MYLKKEATQRTLLENQEKWKATSHPGQAPRLLPQHPSLRALSQQICNQQARRNSFRSLYEKTPMARYVQKNAL